jgi:hypothetical protein
MKKQLFILFGLSLCILIIGCKETHCPAFPKAIADTYFPYTENSVLSYSNINGDVLIFKINSYWLSDSYSLEWNCKCACDDAGASFRTERDTSSLIMEGNMMFYDNLATLMIYISDEFYFSDKFYFDIDGINPYASGVRLFGDTINLTKESNRRITSMQLIAEQGVTRFFDKEQDCEWVLVENSVEEK